MRPPFPSPPEARSLRPEHLYKFAALLFAFALAYRFFDTLSRVFLLAYAAAILAVALNAIVKRIPLRRRWAAALMGVVLLALLGLALWLGGSALLRQVRDLAEQYPAMERELMERAAQLRQRIGIDVDLVGERTRQLASRFFAELSGRDVVGRARGLLESILLPLLVLFGALFALANPNDRLLIPLLRVVPEERRPAFRRLFALLGDRLGGWIVGQLISMTTIGVLAAVAFSVIGVPYALLLGVVNGVAEFVPIVGPWVGGVPAVVIAFLDEPTKGLYAALAIIAIQQVESHVVTPLVMAKAAEVHPFVTIFSLLLFGGIFGFLGILLALPLVLLVWTAVQVLWVERAIGAGEDSIPPVVPE